MTKNCPKEKLGSNGDTSEISDIQCSPNKNEKHIFKSKYCIYFSEFGYCKFGSNCKYVHENKSYSSSKVRISNRENPNKKKENVKSNESSILSNTRYNVTDEKSSKQVCRYFKAGFCEKGNYCNFRHSFNLHKNDKCLNTQSMFDCNSEKSSAACSNRAKKRSVPLCHYFKKGMCYKGDQCKYYHQSKGVLKNSSISSSLVSIDTQNGNLLQGNPSNLEKFSNTNNTVTIAKERQNIKLSSLSSEDISKLRTTELNQMKKRFPHHDIIAVNKTFSVEIQPSDPDWPFDLKILKIEITFPEDYPIEKCSIIVIEGEEFIPELLMKHLNKSISEWLDEKHESNVKNDKVELIFRPFLKWFDRNLEELFISGLKKVKQDLKAKEAGIEYVPVENLFSTIKESDSDENVPCNDNLEKENENQVLNITEQNVLILQEPNTNSFQNNSNNGFKIFFSELELTEGAAALICTKISVTLHCSRCKTSFNMKSAPEKNNIHICSKCTKEVGFVFIPSTLHQFSNVLGNLYLLDCVAVDINLVECHFLVDCLNCSKQVPVDSIHYGQKHKMWCNFCHQKMIMTIGSVKFQTLKLESIPTIKFASGKKIEKKVKDPVIKGGEPLPNFGACKHYKKSYRWLRFPCCGRLYPCDECHNENELDHEMKYASRMICGFCSKEQPYSRDKPCSSCSQSLTKRYTTHWEGGKGCRNRILMNRVDKQKYSGMSKTVSRKAQSTKLKN